MAAKSRGKFIAFVLSSVEREFRRVLPPQLAFAFVSNDLEERLALLAVQGQEITNVKQLYEGDGVQEGLITRAEGRQLLVDAEVLPREFLVAADSTDQAEISDTESAVTENIVKCYSTGPVVIVRRRTVHRRQAPPRPVHNPAAVAAVQDYEAQLRQIYADWARSAAAELEATPADEREDVLAALLLLLATALKQAGAAGLTAAYELGVAGELDDEMEAELAAAIAANSYYIDASLIPDVRARFLTDTSAPEFGWTRPELATAADGAGVPDGQLWRGLLGRDRGGLAHHLARRNDPPVFRYLDPTARHCGTCPDKEGEYANWAEMVARCGGVPGDGSDECGPGCRCGVYAYIDGDWVALL